MELIRKKENSAMKVTRTENITYLTFPALAETGIVKHLFTTREGGVSEGYLASLNLSYTRGDKKENVDENFSRVARQLGCRLEDLVFTDQTHTANIRIVKEEDRGKGMIKERDYANIDGLVTNIPGIVLSAFFADCVPLYLVDPIKHVIGLSHSGWRGTVQKIGKETIQVMHRQFGCRPSDILAAIGPSICGECYEVDFDVAKQFMEVFPEDSLVVKDTKRGKYLLNLWEANKSIFQEAGVLAEHISTTDLCTCCNPDFLFSHRASKGKRGNMGAFLMLDN